MCLLGQNISLVSPAHSKHFVPLVFFSLHNSINHIIKKSKTQKAIITFCCTLVKVFSWRDEKRNLLLCPTGEQHTQNREGTPTSVSSQKSHEVLFSSEPMRSENQLHRLCSRKKASHLPTKIFQSCLSFHFKFVILFFYQYQP